MHRKRGSPFVYLGHYVADREGWGRGEQILARNLTDLPLGPFVWLLRMVLVLFTIGCSFPASSHAN